MELYFKIAAGFLLLVQAFHMAGSNEEPDSTVTPGRTIHSSWLRDLVKNGQNAAAERTTGEEEETDGMESSDDNMFVTGYTTMSIASGEDGEMANEDKDAATTSSGVTIVNTTTIPLFVSDTTMQPEEPETEIPQTSPATSPTVSSQVNVTGAKEEIESMTTTAGKNSTAHPTTQSTTAFPDLSNGTDSHETTLTPESNDTQDSTPETDTETWPTNNTETTANVTTTEAPEINGESTTPLSTVDFPSETTETIPVTSATTAAGTPEEANVTDKGAASGSSSERGLASDITQSKRNKTWGAILGTSVAVACVGLVVYIILKKKHQKDFSHRKLVEEFPSDPVLRLDNSEPLDLNYRGGYHNPGLQMDSIQMTNFPGSNN